MGTQAHTIDLPAVEAAGSVREIAVPPAARALSTLSRIDYEEAFVVDAAAVQWRTAEQWARAIFDDAPAALRGALWSTWVVLGLRLGSPWSGRRVVGWELRRSTHDHTNSGRAIDRSAADDSSTDDGTSGRSATSDTPCRCSADGAACRA